MGGVGTRSACATRWGLLSGSGNALIYEEMRCDAVVRGLVREEVYVLGPLAERTARTRTLDEELRVILKPRPP
jgi:hypothetical protein